MEDQLRDLAAHGQSVWLDNIRRSMFASGELAHLIGIGLRGMTSNPTIFANAIDGSTDYDAQLEILAESENDPQRLFEALAIDDIRSACDLFRPVFDATNRLDGYVSLEVSPTLARDTHGTTLAAARLWDSVARPNAMIKIPGTPECLPSIRASIAAGININVTLLFSPEQYAAAANAYILGLEDRATLGMRIDAIASVASVFVSRIDTKVDGMLEERNAPAELMGTAGVATLKATYSRFGELFDGERFAALIERQANVQRPLWASTSTKNPAYDDLMYVLRVVGADTVNTMPLNTIEALLNHGLVRGDTISDSTGEIEKTIAALAQAGIDLEHVAEELQAAGVDSFARSFDELLSRISSKQKAIAR